MKLKIVKARTGIDWVKQGFRTFFKQPIAISGLFLMFLLTMSLLGSIPLVGSALALVLLPAATLGLMAASEEASQGKFPMPKVLIVAFQSGATKTRSMLILGFIYSAVFLLVLAITALVDGGQFAKLYLMGGTINEEMLQDERFELAALISVMLYTPLSMLFWHAPALVHWHGISPLKSLFFSVIACFKNFWAFTVFGLGWAAAFLAISMFIGIVVALLGNPQWMAASIFPAAIWMASIFFASIYFTYKDCFETETEPTP
jgi:hypothetical protein